MVVETGGNETGATPLGSGLVEVRNTATLLYRGLQGSAYNASGSANYNTIALRYLGVVRLDNSSGTYGGAGGQGRWGDNVGITLDGGTFGFSGAPNLDSYEKIGTVTAGLGFGTINLVRSNSGNAILEVTDILRGSQRGSLALTTTAGALNAAAAYERLRVTSPTFSNAGSTNTGSGASSGIAPVWMVDATNNTYLSYQGASLGLQPVLSTATPVTGQVAFSNIVSGAFTTGLSAGTATVDVTANSALADNPNIYALRLGNIALTTATPRRCPAISRPAPIPSPVPQRQDCVSVSR
ncbi:MAG: hypothetical protein QM775_13170 [Pirellulales bacterium]